MATIDSLRNLLDDLSTELDEFEAPDPAPYVGEITGNFSHALGDSGAELLANANQEGVYIDVSTVEDGLIELTDDDAEELITALQAALTYRRRIAAGIPA